MDKESLLQHFMANRPARKFKTNEQYALRLSKLARDNNKTDNTFLQQPEDVFKMLDNKPVTTKANILTAIIDYLLIEKADPAIIKIYKERKQTNQDKYYQENEKGTLIGKQKDNFVPYEKLLEYYDKIEDEIKKHQYETNDKYPAREYLNLRILLRLYLLYPSRNEYSNLEMISLRDFKKKKYLMKNYLVVPGRSQPFLSINEYKTAARYKEKRTEITDTRLKQLILFHKKKFGEGNMFQTHGGKQYDNTDLSKLLSKYTKIYLGKSISTTLMYKIIIQKVGQDFHKAIEEDRDEDAEKYRAQLAEHARIRGHAAFTQKQIYIKESDPPSDQ